METTKICPDCKQELPASSFFQRFRHGKYELQYTCIQCGYARKRRWWAENKEQVKDAPDYSIKSRAAQLKYLYNITLEQFNQMADDQNHRCKICDKLTTDLCVDHNRACCQGKRSCGKCVRGLLCDTCNFMLGAVNDNPEILLEAVEYLEFYNH